MIDMGYALLLVARWRVEPVGESSWRETRRLYSRNFEETWRRHFKYSQKVPTPSFLHTFGSFGLIFGTRGFGLFFAFARTEIWCCSFVCSPCTVIVTLIRHPTHIQPRPIGQSPIAPCTPSGHHSAAPLQPLSRSLSTSSNCRAPIPSLNLGLVGRHAVAA